MTWYDRGRQITADPTLAAGLGETPYAYLDDFILIALMDSGYSFLVTHQQFDDVSAGEITALGYVARGDGRQLASKTVTVNTPVVEMDAADLVYPDLGNGTNDTIESIVVARDLDSGPAAATTELIAHVAVSSTLTNGGSITLVFASTGLLTLSET